VWKALWLIHNCVESPMVGSQLCGKASGRFTTV
jgi:hypothetical protein